MNINPHPSFKPTPGTPTAAPAYFPYHHDSLARIWRREARRKFDAARHYAHAHGLPKPKWDRWQDWL